MLAKPQGPGLAWAHCEALERRHNLGRGLLVVLELVPESGLPSYKQRRAMLELLVPNDAVFSGDTSRPVPCRVVVLMPTMRALSTNGCATRIGRFGVNSSTGRCSRPIPFPL
jgi:hypothetical protein